MVRKEQKAGFWEEVEAGIESEEIRADLRRVLEQQRKTGHPTDDRILDALRNREQHERDMSELRLILAQECPTPLATLRKWRSLMGWGLRRFASESADGGALVDFKQGVIAHRLYGTDKASPTSPELLWVNAVRSVTDDLWPQVHAVGLDPMPLHRLLQDVDAILAGKVVDVARSNRDLDQILRELEKRAEHGPELDAAAEAKEREQAARQQEQDLLREHAESPSGRAILRTLLRDGGQVKTAVLKQAALAEIETRAEAHGQIDDADDPGSEKHGRRIEETLRVLRDRCSRPSGCAPCADHLGLISCPTRGSNRLTDKGREIALAQRRGN
jgi:hypothetical protein